MAGMHMAGLGLPFKRARAAPARRAAVRVAPAVSIDLRAVSAKPVSMYACAYWRRQRINAICAYIAWLVAKGHLSLVCELWVEIYNVFRGEWLPYRWICQPVARAIGRACAGRVVTHLAQAYIAAYESASSIRVPLESSWRGMSAYIACHLAGILKGTANIAGDS